MIKTPQAKLSLKDKRRKILYISELMEKDAEFDADIRAAMLKSFKRGYKLSKLSSMSQMTDIEILDINNPIEQPK